MSPIMRGGLLVLLAASVCGCANLYHAAGRGDEEAVRRLLEEGAPAEGSPNWQNLGSSPRPVRVAAEKGHTEIVRMLLDRGAKIEDGPFYASALYHALLNQHEATARLLLERGANTRTVRAGLDKQSGGRSSYAAKNRAGLELLRELEKSSSPATPPVQRAAQVPPPLLPRYSAREERADDLAIVVGVETYSEFSTKAPFAERDADAVKAHLRALGVPERNIVLLKGAKAGRASLAKNVEQWLKRMATPRSRVYFYFSGHGAPDVASGSSYLMPWDGDPNFLETTAYPVARLYRTLGELKAERTIVMLDACFSGAGGRSVLASGARPLVTKLRAADVPDGLTVLAASAPNEISGSLDDRGHGAFTYFLLEGLNRGSQDPSGRVTASSLLSYLTPRVQDEARRLNRDQTPQLAGDGSWPLR